MSSWRLENALVRRGKLALASRALSVLARWVFPAVSQKYDAWKDPCSGVPKKTKNRAAHRPSNSLWGASLRLTDLCCNTRNPCKRPSSSQMAAQLNTTGSGSVPVEKRAKNKRKKPGGKS